MFRGPGLAKVGKLFEIGQVVAEIADHWLSEKLSGAAYWSCRHKKSRDYERCGFRSWFKIDPLCLENGYSDSSL